MIKISLTISSSYNNWKKKKEELIEALQQYSGILGNHSTESKNTLHDSKESDKQHANGLKRYEL